MIENQEELLKVLRQLRDQDSECRCSVEVHMEDRLLQREFDLGHLELNPDGWTWDINRLIEIIEKTGVDNGASQ